jgi:hypothetical protein
MYEARSRHEEKGIVYKVLMRKTDEKKCRLGGRII